MKKLILVSLMAGVLALSFAACGGGADSSTAPSEPVSVVDEVSSTPEEVSTPAESTPEEVEAPADSTVSGEATPEEVPAPAPGKVPRTDRYRTALPPALSGSDHESGSERDIY